ncbi:unnamed protein product, partial [Protopolystoma xenopodis]
SVKDCPHTSSEPLGPGGYAFIQFTIEHLQSESEKERREEGDEKYQHYRMPFPLSPLGQQSGALPSLLYPDDDAVRGLGQIKTLHQSQGASRALSNNHQIRQVDEEERVPRRLTIQIRWPEDRAETGRLPRLNGHLVFDPVASLPELAELVEQGVAEYR